MTHGPSLGPNSLDDSSSGPVVYVAQCGITVFARHTCVFVVSATAKYCPTHLLLYGCVLRQLRPSYDLRMDEPYDRAVAFHLIRRAARDEGLKVTNRTMPLITSCISIFHNRKLRSFDRFTPRDEHLLTHHHNQACMFHSTSQCVSFPP